MSKGNISKTMQAKSNLVADMNLACEYYAIVPFSCNSKKKCFGGEKKLRPWEFSDFFEKIETAVFQFIDLFSLKLNV